MKKRLALALRNAARYFEEFADEAGGEHPIHVAVSRAPEVIRLKLRLRRASARLGLGVADRRAFVVQQDAELAHRTTREEIFFGLGYQLGVQASRAKRRKR